jgi:hypothetical protein
VNVTDEEFQILDEALDAWIEKDMAGEIIGHVFEAMVSGNSPEGHEAFKRKIKEDSAKSAQQRATRKRIATILKAKLYEIQSSVSTNSIIQNLKIS